MFSMDQVIEDCTDLFLGTRRFALLLTMLARVFGVQPNVFHIFWDTQGSTIAFNRSRYSLTFSQPELYSLICDFISVCIIRLLLRCQVRLVEVN
jgi:hypothetical protein